MDHHSAVLLTVLLARNWIGIVIVVSAVIRLFALPVAAAPNQPRFYSSTEKGRVPRRARRPFVVLGLLLDEKIDDDAYRREYQQEKNDRHASAAATSSASPVNYYLASDASTSTSTSTSASPHKSSLPYVVVGTPSVVNPYPGPPR